jgi:hypothetical protein
MTLETLAPLRDDEIVGLPRRGRLIDKADASDRGNHAATAAPRHGTLSVAHVAFWLPDHGRPGPYVK